VALDDFAWLARFSRRKTARPLANMSRLA
jgi:hypothetical protein